ncbi:hypothetical protein CONLIGDRAFT_647485 [Coniochaeta ligniaria NRRL 30616]|uniref:Uncharacterized protein n=1 Tax=Coniochaeta ligniaria NRRL 30616 TaxID=1408157 RepID=A0A1J7J988_9PEZI|nr:hypothetical protein CONLIGDRAFT_647485 [Coniochaeta ligniaria NRRL 30616]
MDRELQDHRDLIQDFADNHHRLCPNKRKPRVATAETMNVQDTDSAQPVCPDAPKLKPISLRSSVSPISSEHHSMLGTTKPQDDGLSAWSAPASVNLDPALKVQQDASSQEVTVSSKPGAQVNESNEYTKPMRSTDISPDVEHWSQFSDLMAQKLQKRKKQLIRLERDLQEVLLSSASPREKDNTLPRTSNSKRRAPTSPPRGNSPPAQKKRQGTGPGDKLLDLQRYHEEKLPKPAPADLNSLVSADAPKQKEFDILNSDLSSGVEEPAFFSFSPPPGLGPSLKGKEKEDLSPSWRMYTSLQRRCLSARHDPLAHHVMAQASVAENEIPQQDGQRFTAPVGMLDPSPLPSEVFAPRSICRNEEQLNRKHRDFAPSWNGLKQTHTTRPAPGAAVPSCRRSRQLEPEPFLGDDEEAHSTVAEAGDTTRAPSPTSSPSSGADSDSPTTVDGDTAAPNETASTPTPPQNPYIDNPAPEFWVPIPRTCCVRPLSETLADGYAVIRVIVFSSGQINYYEESTKRQIRGVHEFSKSHGGLAFVAIRYQVGNLLDEGIRVLSSDMIHIIESVSRYRGDDENSMVPPYLRQGNALPLPFAAAAVSSSSNPGPAHFKSESAGLWCNKTFLYHHQEDLADIVDDPGSSEEDVHVNALLIHLACNSLSSAEFNLCYNQFPRGLVSAATALYLFCPGQLAFANTLRIGGVDSVVVVDKVVWDSRFNQAVITCWNWGYEPDRLSRRQMQCTVAFPPKGTVKIRDLDIYPISTEILDLELSDLTSLIALEPPEKLLVDQFLSTGEKVWALIQQPTLIEYTYVGPRHQSFPCGSRFMIDSNLCCHNVRGPLNPRFTNEGSGSIVRCVGQEPKNPHDRYPDHVKLFFNGSNKPPSLLLLLMPPQIPAFSLQKKQEMWRIILARNITVPAFDTSAVDHLSLTHLTKSKLTRFSKSYHSAFKPNACQIRSPKPPKPPLLHFHGAAGRGKTAAARAVAEILHAPLLIPDLSWLLTTDRAEFGRASENYRTIASRWGCVMVLDEADYWVSYAGFDQFCADDGHGHEEDHGHEENAISRLTTLLDMFPGIVILVTRAPTDTLNQYIASRVTWKIDFNDEFAKIQNPLNLWWKILHQVDKKDDNLRLDLLQSDDSQLRDLASSHLCMGLNGHQITSVVEGAWMNARRLRGQAPTGIQPIYYFQIEHIEDALMSLHPGNQSE